MVAKTLLFQCKSALGNKDAQCNYKNHVIALLLIGVNVWAQSSHMIIIINS